MPPNGNADLAHPEAADWVMGTLGPEKASGFQLHLADCRDCQAAVAEFGALGQALQHLPPAAPLPPGLEDRTIASVLAAAAEGLKRTQPIQVLGDPSETAPDRVAAEVHHEPGASAQAAGPSFAQAPARLSPTPQHSEVGPRPADGTVKALRFPRWRGRTGLLAVASSIAAAVIIAAVLILQIHGTGPSGQALAFRLAPPPGPGQAASGTATARPDTSGSWDITLTVHHLKNFEDSKWYECWYVGVKGKAASAGTFLVPDSGDGTFSMTSAVDPHDFPTMEIKLVTPGQNDPSQGTVVLSGTGEKTQ
jgi:hypothetical protein